MTVLCDQVTQCSRSLTFNSAFLAQQAEMTSHHTRQKNYRLHTVTRSHNTAHVNYHTCGYLFQKENE